MPRVPPVISVTWDIGKAYYNACVRIVILGAGEIGAAAARQLAAAGVARRVVLVDPAASVAAGKALDIAQAAPVDRYETAVSGTDDESVVAGASLVLIADRHGAPPVEWTGDQGLDTLRRVSRWCGEAPLVCAGSQQGALIERGVRELGLDRQRLFGTAPEALRGGLISLVALEANLSPAEIAVTIVGRAPAEIIVPWEAASLGGRRALDVLSPPAITRLEQRLARLWPPASLTLGAAAAAVARTMLVRAPRVHVAQVALTREEGPSRGSAILPVRVDASGIRRVEPPSLSSRDRVRLDTVLAR